MGEITAWLVVWTFASRPKASFYNLLEDLLGERKITTLAPRTVRCCEAESAYLVRALVEKYGGTVQAFAANGRQLDDRVERSRAAILVEQVQAARLSSRRHSEARDSTNWSS